MNRRRAILALLATGGYRPLHAEPPAGRPLRILVGFTAGGTTDRAARLLADELRVLLHRPVVVDNRPGASGRIAALTLKHSVPDGSTVMLAPFVVTVLAPYVFASPGYDPARDFAPVAHVARYAIALAVGAGVPARTVQEFAAWARESQKRASYGVSAAGGLPHLFGVAIGRSAGIDWVAVPYRGIAALEADLAGGHIAAAIDALSSLINTHRAARARIIATSGLERSPLLPDVPTFREQGLSDMTGEGWVAMYAPVGTPRVDIDELAFALAEVLRTPRVREAMLQLGFTPTGTGPEELAAVAEADAMRWAPIIRSEKFRAD